jgi:hypothetical protein
MNRTGMLQDLAVPHGNRLKGSSGTRCRASVIFEPWESSKSSSPPKSFPPQPRPCRVITSPAGAQLHVVPLIPQFNTLRSARRPRSFDRTFDFELKFKIQLDAPPARSASRLHPRCQGLVRGRPAPGGRTAKLRIERVFPQIAANAKFARRNSSAGAEGL